MNVLVLNSGSSTLKYQLLDMPKGNVLLKGNIERIGDKSGAVDNHGDAVKIVFEQLGDKRVDAVGHRVVHGGEVFKSSTIATPETLSYLETVSHLAPLHNPANILGVRACMEFKPELQNIMVFDTAFHATIPQSAYLYALSIHDYIDHGIRRYGFHGPSHSYVSKLVSEKFLLGEPSKFKIITVHLGNGCSICAVDKGKSVETSMGLTPLEGLVMGTRSGDIDPAVVGYLAKAHGHKTIDETINYLNKQCGIMGLAGLGSADVRDLILQIDKHDVQGAFDVYCHRITKYIGAYIAVMNGCDAIVWTGGVGNNMPLLREKVMKNFKYVGANIDPNENAKYYNNGLTGEISSAKAKIRTFVVNTNEELEIANETIKILGKKN